MDAQTAVDSAELGWHEGYWDGDLAFNESTIAARPPWALDFLSYPESRVLLFPPRKLAFCYIEKNACTQFNRLFNSLNGFLEKGGEPWFMSDLRTFGLSYADISRGKGWRWAVFVRDPLPRYLSAWGSKCVQQEDFGDNCIPAGMLSKKPWVKQFERNVLANAENPGPLSENPHWAPQQDFCGGLKNASDYDFVGHLWGDVQSQVKAMLRMVDAPDDQVERFFPSGRFHSGHTTGMQPKVFYQNWTIQKLVKRMYHRDFNLPGLVSPIKLSSH